MDWIQRAAVVHMADGRRSVGAGGGVGGEMADPKITSELFPFTVVWGGGAG